MSKSDNILHNPKFKEYLRLGIKPKEAIRKYNKLGRKKNNHQMADGAHYIRSSAKKLYPEITTLLCKFHFWKAIHPKIYSKDLIPPLEKNKKIPLKYKDHFTYSQRNQNQISEHETRNIIKSDIRILEVLPSKELYLSFLKVVLPFWKYFAPKFYEYFWKYYLDQSNLTCLFGWQNFIKLTHPGTNNAVEGINRSLKENINKYEKLEFGKYLELICEELVEMSEASGNIISFPNSPVIPQAIIRFAIKLSETFNNNFEIHKNKFYIKDKLVNYSLYNRRSGAIKKETNQKASKVNNNDDETVKNFLSYYSKPNLNQIEKFINPQLIKTRLQVIPILSISEITIYESNNNQESLLMSTCTCPDFFKAHICQHLLECLIQKKLYDPAIRFKKPKKKGRKPKICPALQRDSE